MFKLFRDSIFNPKNIIAYRAKKVGFVILYMLFVSLFMAISLVVEPLSYSGISSSDKIKISQQFKLTDARLVDGTYNSNYIVEVAVDDYQLTFVNNDSDIALLETLPDFLIEGDTLYMVYGVGSLNYKFGISKLVNLSSKFENVDLYRLDIDSEFFDGINETIKRFKPVVVITSFISGLFSGISTMLFFAVFTYVFMQISVRANRYMKKGQLFKMLIYCSTLMTLGSALLNMIDYNYLISFIIIGISFIPLYKFEREIFMRIRMKELGEKTINNQSVIDKINEIIKSQTNNNDDSDDNNDNSEE